MPASAEQMLDPRSFQQIAELAYHESGLTLVEEKSGMIQARLRKRLSVLGMTDFSTYSSFVTSPAGKAERRQLISALTTNVSHFFRENHHLDHLCDMVEAQHLDRLRRGGKLRIWSAGCSNGQECCSVGIRLLERFPQIAGLDLRILGTDIDPNVVNFARAGIYDARQLNEMPKPLLSRYFRQKGDRFETVPKLRELMTFNELNLLAGWPMKNKFDFVFCRNVVIYFDHANQTALWPRFRQVLHPGGHLYLGHSERIVEPRSLGFVLDGPTTYRLQCSSPVQDKES